MELILNAAAMRAADRLTIDGFGLPGFTLMETAGRGCAAAMEQHLGPLGGRRVTVFCGKGNNGGDGLVAARTLAAQRARVRVVLMEAPGAFSPDAAAHYRLVDELARHAPEHLVVDRFENLTQVAAFRTPDVFVDALLGTGLASPLREPYAGLVDWLNAQAQPVVALDVPTGLHSDTGLVLGTAVRAALTLTMAARKAGLLLNEGPRHTGHVEVIDIGMPRHRLEEAAAAAGLTKYPDDADVAARLPARPYDAHKYSVGLALVVAGSPGMTGAPVMAATAAARAGAGFVTCACPEAVQPTLAHKLTEVTTLALPWHERVGLDPEGSLDALAPRLEKTRAVLVGCGLGGHPGTQAFVRRLLPSLAVPAVVDADGLNALAGRTELLTRHAQGRWILTPHAGEFQRLAGGDVDLTDRIEVVRAYAQRWQCVLVLKGAPALVGTPEGVVYVNRTNHPALATAGTGDVLAGLCTGLLAQGLAPVDAALCALYVGGAAAQRYVARRGAGSLLATDLLAVLPRVLHERFARA